MYLQNKVHWFVTENQVSRLVLLFTERMQVNLYQSNITAWCCHLVSVVVRLMYRNATSKCLIHKNSP